MAMLMIFAPYFSFYYNLILKVKNEYLAEYKVCVIFEVKFQIYFIFHVHIRLYQSYDLFRIVNCKYLNQFPFTPCE